MHPVLFQIGNWTVHTYGALVAVALLVAWMVARSMAIRQGLSPTIAGDFLFIFFVGGIIGARLLFVAEHWASFRGALFGIFMIQEGGLSWFGAFIGGALAGVVWARWRRIPVLRWIDFFAPIIVLGHAIGRIGCYLNGCCGGAAGTLMPFPIQLVEAALLFVLFVVLICLSYRPIGGPPGGGARRFFSFRTGDLTVVYCVGYGLLRFWIEFYRQDQTQLGVYSLAQWLSMALAIFGVFLFLFLRLLGRFVQCNR